MTAQTIGNSLQLAGSIITLGGLAYAWHITTGRITQLLDNARAWLLSFRKSVDQWIVLEPITGSGEFGTMSVTIGPMTPSGVGHVDNGTDEERLARLETENARRADEIRDVQNKLSKEINQEISKVQDMMRKEIDSALEDFKRSSDAIRLKDIWPAMAGLVVSIVGIAWQLFG